MANQFRDYCITYNNPKETDEEFLAYIQGLPHVKYGVFQREIGEKRQTPHFHLYIEFTLGKRFGTMKGYFPTAHIEQRRSKDKKKAREYCMKERKDKDNDGDISDFQVRVSGPYEFGTFAEERERTDLSDIIAMVKSGAADSEIQEAYPSQFFMYYRNIQFLRQQFLEEKFRTVFREIEVTYIYGGAGIGKTRFVMEKHGYENVFRMTDYGNAAGGEKFDSYNGQPVIAFEEFRGGIRISDMLNYLDGYPLTLPARYSNKTACFTKAYIITNLPLEQQYLKIQQEHPETWKAFLRRITWVYNFDESQTVPISKNGKPFKSAQVSIKDLKPIEDEDLPF